MFRVLVLVLVKIGETVSTTSNPWFNHVSGHELSYDHDRTIR